MTVLEKFFNKTLELFALLFFKSITILGTVSSVYMLLNYVHPVDGLEYNYIYVGVALGAIIAFYVTPHFSRSNDTMGLIVAILIISFISYMPSSAVFYKWLERKAVETITITKPNYKAFNSAKNELLILKAKRANYLNEPLAQKEEFIKTKQSFITNRLFELDSFHYVVKDGTVQLDKKGNKKIRWGKFGYKKYKSITKGFESDQAEAEYQFNKKLKTFDALLAERKTDSYLVSTIAQKQNRVTELSPVAYENAVIAKKASVPSFYIIMFLTLVLGIVIESLGELPYWLKLRKQSIQPEPTAETEEQKEPSNVIMLPYINQTTVKPNVELPLTEANLLEERFRDVKEGDKLIAKAKLPFKQDRKLTTELAKLNGKLKEGGFITKSTHPVAIKTLEEAKAYILREVA